MITELSMSHKKGIGTLQKFKIKDEISIFANNKICIITIFLTILPASQ